MQAAAQSKQVIDILEVRINRLLLRHFTEMRTDLDQAWKILAAVTSVCSEVRDEMEKAMDPDAEENNMHQEKRKRQRLEGEPSLACEQPSAAVSTDKIEMRTKHGTDAVAAEHGRPCELHTDANRENETQRSTHPRSQSSPPSVRRSSTRRVKRPIRYGEHPTPQRHTVSNTARGTAVDAEKQRTLELSPESVELWSKLICEAYDELAPDVEGMLALDPGEAISVILTMWDVLPHPKQSDDQQWQDVLSACRNTPRLKKWKKGFLKKVEQLPEINVRDPKVLHRLRVSVKNRWDNRLGLTDSSSENDSDDGISPDLAACEGSSQVNSAHTSLDSADPSDVGDRVEVADPLDQWAEAIYEAFEDLSLEVAGLSKLDALSATQLVLTMLGIIPAPRSTNSPCRPWVAFLDKCCRSQSGRRWIKSYEEARSVPVVDFQDRQVLNSIRWRVQRRWGMEVSFPPVSNAETINDVNSADSCEESKSSTDTSTTGAKRNYPSRCAYYERKYSCVDPISLWASFIWTAFDDIAAEVTRMSTLGSASIVRLMLTTWGILPKPESSHYRPWVAFLDDCLNSRRGKKWVARYNNESSLPVMNFLDERVFRQVHSCVNRRYRPIISNQTHTTEMALQ